MKTRKPINKDLYDAMSEKLIREGMPRHCGLCSCYSKCSSSDPYKICPWLRKAQTLLFVSRRIKDLGFSLIVLFCLVNLSFAGVVGTNGGEVVSSDGKVKLVVPAGALVEEKNIELVLVDRAALNNAVPQNAAMLSVVDCSPQGLVFNSPVSLVYTLTQAEIPGTQVELGLYDSEHGRIVPTGQTAVVQSDGYSVSFSLEHFSTYAALKNLVSQGAPIGSGVKIPLPDLLTGAFSYSLPISIPPARKGVQPALALTYRSNNGNSWLGMGFGLNPGYIVRSTKLGPPIYNDLSETFYFITDSGTTELVHLVDNLYQAKIESSFLRFYKESGDYWKVVSKDGSVLWLGQAEGAKEIAAGGTFAWYLTKAVDTNGNYVEYQYTKDEGKSYLNKINYAGNESGLSSTNSVEFVLEPRDDVFSSYISGSKIVTRLRLKQVLVKANNELVWRYELHYGVSADTDRSLLARVTRFSSDNQQFPVQSFIYQESH